MLVKIKDIIQNRQTYFDLLSHWGLKYKCPFCGFHSRDLLPIGITNPAIEKYQIIGAGLRNARCPKCGSTDRERLIYTYLKHELDIFSNPQTKVLHIAPEMIIANQFVAHGFTNYICGDYYAKGQHANYSKEFVKHMDVQNLPFADNSFDLIICNHVLEHVFDEKRAIQELFRVLTKGGQAILQVPISPILEKTISDTTITDGTTLEEKFGQWDHVRLFGMDYAQKLESCGFSVEQYKFHKKYPKFAFNSKEILFIGRK
jgi:SAM-dependent methyltransferase